MGFHYAKEKRKFEREWEQLKREYRLAGMSEHQIETMRNYDWTWFRSQRIFQTHTQPLPSEYFEEGQERTRMFQKFDELSCYWKSGMLLGRYGWIYEIENEALFGALWELPSSDLDLLTLIFIYGYRQSEVARIYGCSRNVIYKRLRKLRRLLKSKIERGP